MYNMVFGHVWMLYAITVVLVLAFTLAGFYALSASGDIRQLPLTRMAIIVIIVLYSLRALAGGWVCVADFFTDAQQHVSWLQFFSSVIPAFIAWCYYPGLKKTMPGAARAAKLVWMAESWQAKTQSIPTHKSQQIDRIPTFYRHDDYWTVILHPCCMGDCLHRPLRSHTGRTYYSQQIIPFVTESYHSSQIGAKSQL